MRQAIRHLLIELFSQYGLQLKLNRYEVDESEARYYPVIETSNEQCETIKATPFRELEEQARVAITASPQSPGPESSWQEKRRWQIQVEMIVEREVSRLLSDRYLSFDTERINDDDDYAALLFTLARLTNGEWRPRNVVSRLSPDRANAVLEFDDPLDQEGQWSKHRVWHIPQDDDWVSAVFDEQVKRLAADHPGAFFYLPSDDQ